MKWFIRLSPYEELPSDLYGRAYSEPWFDSHVYVLIPFNWPVRWARSLWLTFRFPGYSRYEKRIQSKMERIRKEAYKRGHQDGTQKTVDSISAMIDVKIDEQSQAWLIPGGEELQNITQKVKDSTQ